MPNFRSIKFRFAMLVMLLLTTAVCARLFIGIPFLRNQVEQLVLSQEQSLANYAAHTLDDAIQSRLSAIDILAADLQAGPPDHTKALVAWLQARHRDHPQFDQIMLVDALGTPVGLSAQSGPNNVAGNYAREAWFHQAVVQHRTVLGPPERSPRSEGIFIRFAAPLYTPHGQLRGVLSGQSRLDSPTFLDGLQASLPGKNGRFLLVIPGNQLLLTISTSSPALTAIPPVGSDALHDQSRAGFETTHQVADADGTPYLAVRANLPDTGWYLVAAMPQSEAMRPADALHSLSLKGSAILLILLFAGVALFLFVVLAPLSKVAQAMREMANGTRPLTPFPVRRRDEIGDLLRGFNHLVAKLGEKELTLTNTLKTLDQLASTDALTGAWNRRLFSEQATREHERAARQGLPLSLMLLDLDRFKHINDTWGHAEGDRVLQQVAQCILRILRKTDALARWGGEEFIILLPDTGLEQAAMLAERVRARIEEEQSPNGPQITTSIGVATYTPPESHDQWVARADAAMYRAKRLGRNRVEIDQPGPASPFVSAGTETPPPGKWHEQLSSGHVSLDAQHQGLLEDSHQLYESLQDGTDTERIRNAMEILLKGIAQHCHEEEQLMKRIAYPDFHAHASRHHALLQQAVERVRLFQTDRMSLSEVVLFLTQELVEKHILDEDRLFYTYLNENPS
jgi:diguanylate cyclase (GGDEF)-like protein/hemerythrin-like metal-binding protein